MKIKKRDGSKEKRIVTGMIVSTPVVAQLASVWEKDCFKNKWANIVGGWCVKHYNRYGKAPGKTIEQVFENWAQRFPNQDTIDLVSKYLAGISGEYKAAKKGINAEYLIDEASSHFDAVRAKRVETAIGDAIDRGDTDQAVKAIESFRRAEIGAAAGVDVMLDRKGYFQTFEKHTESLVTYPGALGQFFGPMLCRNSLIAFMGPEKRGKSFWLLDLAWRGMLERRNVVMFQVGDLSKEEVWSLIGVRAAARPLDPGKIYYPKSIEKGFPSAEVKHRIKRFKKGITRKQGWRAINAVQKHEVKSDDSYFKLYTYPSMSVNINQIDAVIGSLAHQGWVADIVCIDYADILAPIENKQDFRHQTSATWAKMKGLTQKYHCLVATATQSDAASYNTYTLEMGNFSEDKRKNAHANGIVGLNATEEEVELGLMRLNWPFRRRGRNQPKKCVHVAGCLGLANPAILSTW